LGVGSIISTGIYSASASNSEHQLNSYHIAQYHTATCIILLINSTPQFHRLPCEPGTRATASPHTPGCTVAVSINIPPPLTPLPLHFSHQLLLLLSLLYFVSFTSSPLYIPGTEFMIVWTTICNPLGALML